MTDMQSEENLPEAITWGAVPAEHRIILQRRYRYLVKQVRAGVRLSPAEQAQFELLTMLMGSENDKHEITLGTIEALLTIQFMDREQDAAEVDQDADNAERLDDSVRMFGEEMRSMRTNYRAAYAYIVSPYDIPTLPPVLKELEDDKEA